MTTTDLTANVASIFRRICGEQTMSWIDDDGDTHFEAFYGGIPVSAFVAKWDDRQNVLVGFHVIGEAIEDMGLAIRFVTEHNHRVTVGRYVVGANNAVIFSYQMPEAAVNRDSVRFLLNVVASASLSYPELSQMTGALRPTDIAALDALTEDTTEE